MQNFSANASRSGTGNTFQSEIGPFCGDFPHIIPFFCIVSKFFQKFTLFQFLFVDFPCIFNSAFLYKIRHFCVLCREILDIFVELSARTEKGVLFALDF